MIEKDESINKREVVVSYLSFQVSDMLAEAALKDAGLIMAPGVSIEIDFMMHGRDSLGYERKTEGLATGARIKIIVDREFKPQVKDEVYPDCDFNATPEPDICGHAAAVALMDEPTPGPKPEPKRDRSGRIKD